MRRFAFTLFALGAALPAGAQQISIPRVEAMPALPADYRLRDWDRVAAQYDSLVFDPAQTGLYFPLVELYSGTVNYPEHGSFGIETYVGSGNEVPGEAINVLPALVGATLVGADKRSQFGEDWVLRAEEFFNRRPQENVYLNLPLTSSGRDWWYETMPNVYFYQLRAFYRGTGHFEAQFPTVADRWLEALGALGGQATPWAVPSFDYRAIALATMTPQPSGVHEPEAAGALAWILYMAYRETGEERYRIGAEWAMEALDGRTQNPSYELQLPYGAFAAARMNAELGTHYDVEQLVNWVFDPGPLRNWGTIVGTWGGYSANGLVGEVDADGYAFAMNGFQQAGALVPLVRYDDRFARAVGRWMVNLASASRLFYWPFLPLEQQDSEAWAEDYDPDAVVAYEGLRQRVGGLSPFATGDALVNGWAPTNLALYGSSSVGYLAAVVDATEAEGVLRLDLRATDFYAAPAYASYLVYNPHPTAQTVTVPLLLGTYDVYDAAADAFLARGVQGTASVTVPPDAARVLVFPTAGGTETVEGGRLAVNGVVVDYRYGTVADYPPRVKALVATDTTLSRGQLTTLYCTGDDAEGAVNVAWSATGGTLVPDGAQATWSSDTVGDEDVTCTVTDGGGQSASALLTLSVVANQAPENVVVTASPDIVDPGGTTTLTCLATDPDGDPLTYTWSAEDGEVTPTGPTTADYTAPDHVGYWPVVCTVTDPSGGVATGTVHVTAGRLVLHLPLDGSAEDVSGFGHDGTVTGAGAAPGYDGRPDGALRFDGLDDHVSVPSDATLNPTEALTVSAWVRPDALPERELFLVSHGSWQNRWKLSVTPAHRPRWTVHTDRGIADLDAPEALTVGRYSHLAATYDGAAMKLYVDGTPVAERAYSGALLTTSLPLLLGQMLPGESDYNFPGALDEVRVYNRALGDDEVAALYAGTLAAESPAGGGRLALGSPYPNPSPGHVLIPLRTARTGVVTVHVVDVLGRLVAVLHDGPLPGGTHTLVWEGNSGEGETAASGVYLVRVTEDGRSVARSFLLLR